MKLTHSFFIAAISLLILTCPPTNAQTPKNRSSDAGSAPTETDPVAIVKAACQDAATVGRVIPPGKADRTIVILEENHASLAVQLELGAVLVRLHCAGLTDVVLEGYLKDEASGVARKPVTREWFRKAAGSLPIDVQREIAARLLKEGEISAAEFFFLAFDDARLLPAETLEVRKAEYTFKHHEAVSKAIHGIADAVVQKAAAANKIDVAKYNQLASAVQSATGDEAKQNAFQALMNYIATLDPWLKSAYGPLTNADQISKAALTDQLRLHEELIVQAERWGTTLDKKLLEEAAEFFRQRAKADKIMSESTVAAGSRLITLNVGAKHTGEIVELLKSKGLGVIVVTPLSLDDEKGALSDAQFEAKHAMRSVFDAGPIARVLKTLPEKKKPGPSITERWFQAKSELYLLISRITRGILGPPAPPGGGEPPFGFDDYDFHGEFFFIDPRRVRYLATEKAVLFPVTRKDDHGTVALWVKSTKADLKEMPASVVSQSGVDLTFLADADRLVAQLLGYRDAVKARSEAPSTAEDQGALKGDETEITGIIQIDIKTLAAVGSNEKAVAAAVVSTR